MSFDKSYTGGGAGNDDLRANYGDTDGTVINAGAGNDILRGGAYNDMLTGGDGSDMMFGGNGADEFRFYGNQMSNGDKDLVVDLTFSQGDTLVFGGFGVGFFTPNDGVKSFFADNSDAIVSSFEGLANLVADSDGIVGYRLGMTNALILELTFGGETQTIQLNNVWAGYEAALAAL